MAVWKAVLLAEHLAQKWVVRLAQMMVVWWVVLKAVLKVCQTAVQKDNSKVD